MISLSDIKEYLKIPTATTTNDIVLTGFINNAKKKIETYCNRKLVYNTFTEYYDGNGLNYLFVKGYPVKSVTTLQYYDETTATFVDLIGSPDTIADSVRYQGDKIILLKGYTFPESTIPYNIKLVYTAGYKCTTGTGTISIPISTKAITGSSTNFDGDVVAGDVIQSEGQNLEVATVTDDTHIVTVENASAAISGKSYVIKDVPDDLKQVMLEMVSVMFDDSANGKGRLRIASENVGAQASQSFTFKEMEERWGVFLNKYKGIFI